MDAGPNGEKEKTSLEGEPPKIFKHIKWLLQHGMAHKRIVIIAVMVVVVPFLIVQRETIAELLPTSKIGEFSVTFSNNSDEEFTVENTAEFYITEPETPGQNARVASGLMKLTGEQLLLKVPSNSSITTQAVLRNEQKIRELVSAGDKFIEVTFSASPKRLSEEFVLEPMLFDEGLGFEIKADDPKGTTTDLWVLVGTWTDATWSNTFFEVPKISDEFELIGTSITASNQTATSVQIRAEADRSSKIVGELALGETVEVVDVARPGNAEFWAKVKK